MGKCVRCGKSGLFFKVNSAGYCKACQELVEREEWRKKKEAEIEMRYNKERNELNSIPKVKISLSDEPRKRQTGFEEPKYSNITPKGVFNNFVVVDTETTGLAPSKDRILELAAVRFVDNQPVDAFHTYINPEKQLSVDAQKVNHITEEMVINAPSISQVLSCFEEYIGNSIVVGHNLEFDLKFLYYSGSNLLEKKCKFIDTYAQAKRMLKSPKVKFDKEWESYEKDYDSDYDVDDYKLDTLCSYYQIIIANQHSALSDAYATGKLFMKLVAEKQ